MKTALILAGFWRTFEFVKQTLVQHIVDPLDCDVFFHAPSTFYTPKRDEIESLQGIYSRHEDQITNETFAIFGNHLKDHIFVDYDAQQYKDVISANNMPLVNNLTNQNHYRILSYAHNISQSMNVFKQYVEKTNEHYDLVILARPDNKYYTDFNQAVVEFDKINCPSHFLLMLEDQQLKDMPWDDRKPAIHRRRPGGAGVHASQLVGPGRWFNDNIVFGSQEKMLTYTNYYDSVIKYFHEGICFNTETMLAVHAFKNGLEWCGTDVITYEVWRQTAFEY